MNIEASEPFDSFIPFEKIHITSQSAEFFKWDFIQPGTNLIDKLNLNEFSETDKSSQISFDGSFSELNNFQTNQEQLLQASQENVNEIRQAQIIQDLREEPLLSFHSTSGLTFLYLPDEIIFLPLIDDKILSEPPFEIGSHISPSLFKIIFRQSFVSDQ